jgi:hypothetical protein
MPQPKPQKFLVGAVMYVLLFAAGEESIGGKDKDQKCGGEEKWEQKVMIDDAAASIENTYVETTIADILTINTKTQANKFSDKKPRMPFESQIYRVRHCFITDVLRENDNDLHLVIEDGNGNHMIAEIPDPECPDAASSDWSELFYGARETMLQYANNYRHYMFSITGVLFLDKAHGQTGRAPNNVEIHPILELKKEKKINPILQ